MFEKSLHDLVKGIRNAKGDVGPYIAKAIQEIKDELKSRDIIIKTQALQKMAYLNMMGHDMSWAAFHVIEVMSQERFALKRIGYWACSQTFTPATDVIVLCTQLLKKDFSARSPYEIGLAINCLANIVTEDLARDLLGDVTTMLTSSRPYIRKKSTLVLYKCYLQYPQGLRLTFDNLKRRLTDESPSVVSCAVSVICELARKKPSNYLSIAPDLFELLTGANSNWMLIKIAKLMSALVQEEPRLARKLLEPLATIVQTTPAKSLMYECIHTITYALQYTKRADGSDAKNAPAVVRLCTDKLREMVREPDQNLKYLGLTGLMNLMRSNPKVVAEHRELVLQCLMDEDVTIRLRALELITGMVTRRNLMDIVKRLLELLDAAEGHFRDELIDKIIFMCSRDKYAYLADFAWYMSVLAKLAYTQGTKHTATVAGQLLDVAVRVEEMRPYAVQTLLPMLADSGMAANARASPIGVGQSSSDGGADATPSSIAGAGEIGSGHVLYAAAWIVGEYCAVIPASVHSAVLDALLQPGTLALPAAVQSVYIQAALKVLAATAQQAVKAGEKTDASSPFVSLASSVLDRLQPFSQSIHVEVQERACLIQQLLASFGVPFTPLPTAASDAAAKAKAEADLMNLAGAPEAAPTSPDKAKAALTPLEPDVKVIAALLGSLFAEQLRPVNPKAQKRVPVPEGLDLDRWIRPEEERAQAEESGAKGGFKYESISFEDSYGIADEEEGETAAPKRSGGGAHDSDDDAWFNSVLRKNRKREKELWGDNSPKKESRKKDKAESGERRDRGSMFYLKDDSRKRIDSDEADLESIPIEKLGKSDLRGALDISMFGDFGKSGKTKKKGKKRDDSDEEPQHAPRAKILDDDDLPPGAKSSDEDVARASDALASVDLSTPLRDDETLPTRAHRVVGDASAAAGRSRGRARVLGGSGEPTEAAPVKEEKKKKKDKKRDADDDGKKKKKSSKDKSAKAAADEPVKSKKAETSASPSSTPAPAAVKQGDAYAAAQPYVYGLATDKVVKVVYTVACKASAASGATGVAGVTFSVDPKSSKKTVDYVDMTFLAPAPVQRSGLVVGASEGSLRIAAGLKEKSKTKSRTQTMTINMAVVDPNVSVEFPVRITYLVTGAAEPVSVEGKLVLRSAAVLVPTAIEPEAYRSLMTTEGSAFQHATESFTPPKGVSAEALLATIATVLRASAIGQSPKHAILYSRTLSGAHVTALLRIDEATGAVAATIKSIEPGHAAILMEDVRAVLASRVSEEVAE